MTAPVNDGHDVAHYQGDFPWDWSRARGHRLGACKATQGVSRVDPKLARNRLGMAVAGFRYRGLYHWLSIASPAARQLAHFRATVGDLEVGEFIQLDCEEKLPTGKILSVEQIAEAWALWNAAYPGRVIVYGGRFYNGWLFDPRLREVPWWLAWYRRCTWAELVAHAARTGVSFPWLPVVWQWGGGEEGDIVPGVVAHGGRCDSNTILRVDVLEQLCGYPPPAPEPAPPVMSEEDPMLKLIYVPRDPAVWATDGLTARSAVSHDHIVRMQRAKVFDPDAFAEVTRDDLRELHLVGDLPSYDGLLPDVAALNPDRTTRDHFAPDRPIVLGGQMAISGSVRVVG